MVVIRKIEDNEEIETAANILAEAFYDDPLFKMVFPKNSRHQKAVHFFSFLLKSNTILKDGVFSASINTEIAGVCSLSYPKKDDKLFFNFSFLFDTCKLIFQIGFTAFFTLNKYFKLIRKTKITNIYYLNFIGVSTKYRGQGVAKHLVEYIHRIVESDNAHSEIRLDTENSNNVAYYQKLGYQVIDQVKFNDITIYCFRKFL